MPKTKVMKAMPKSPAKPPKAQSDPVSLILPYLYLGPWSLTSAKSTFIAKQGITHIISVGRKPGSAARSIVSIRLSIDDDPSANLGKVAAEATAFIDKVLSENESNKIFVHCSAGISRSPAVVTFYLMQSCGMSLKRALGLIIGARPNACPNPGFISQLQKVELELRGSSSLPPSLISLPSKKEDRLALLQDDQLDADDVELSESGKGGAFFFVPECERIFVDVRRKASQAESNMENSCVQADGHAK